MADPREIPLEVHFQRHDDCVVFAPTHARHEVSILYRGRRGEWHCALCDSHDCRHTRAADSAQRAR